MIADVAFVLALAWWVLLVWFVLTLRRAARDPEITVKIMRKVGSMAQRPKAGTSAD